MPRNNFIHEIINTHVALHPGYIAFYSPVIQHYIKTGALPVHDFEPSRKLSFFSESGQMLPGQPSGESDSVAVIPIQGFLTKEGTWCNYGGDEIGAMITQAMHASEVRAVVLDIYTPGGSTSCLPPMKAAIDKRTKPVIAAINSNAYSAGYYIAAMADSIIAVDEMSQVGSIGVMVELYNDDKFRENEGFQVHRIIPPESKYKNLSWMEARDGNFDMLIKEELSPWAQHFQNHVIRYRPNLDQSVEGILEGKTFYGLDSKQFGLIDDIMPFDEIIQFAFEKATRDKKLTNFLN